MDEKNHNDYNQNLGEREQFSDQPVNAEEKSNKPKRSLRNKILAWTLIPLAIILSFTGGFFSRYLFYSDGANATIDIAMLIEKVGCIYDPVTGEERNITEEELADALVSGILDDYSAYYTKEEYDEEKRNAKGRFSGVGIGVDDDGEISLVTFNSPAELAGVKLGDIPKSVTVDGQTALYSKNQDEDFFNLLRDAKVGETVTLTVTRDGAEMSFDIVKSNYVASYVKYMDNEKSLDFRAGENGKLTAVVSDGGNIDLKTNAQTAYIKFTQFNGDATWQMGEALEFMKSRGKTKLILDIRDNGGGYLDILQEIASYFINNGGKSNNLISYAKGKKTSLYSYTKKNKFYGNITSIAVLANDGTASASECLLGAMLHYKDCFDESKLIIEKNYQGVARTYGKGIMQTTYGLLNGGALKLTTAKIYLPDQTTSIHGVGFRPLEENAVEKGEALVRAIEVLA